MTQGHRTHVKPRHRPTTNDTAIPLIPGTIPGIPACGEPRRKVHMEKFYKSNSNLLNLCFNQLLPVVKIESFCSDCLQPTGWRASAFNCGDLFDFFLFHFERHANPHLVTRNLRHINCIVSKYSVPTRDSKKLTRQWLAALRTFSAVQ